MTTPAASDAPLRIEGEMTIYRAEELKRRCWSPAAPHHAGGQFVGRDRTGHRRRAAADAYQAHRAKQQGQLRLVGHSAAVLEVFDLLHLAAYFGDDLVIPQPLGATRA